MHKWVCDLDKNAQPRISEIYLSVLVLIYLISENMSMFLPLSLFYITGKVWATIWTIRGVSAGAKTEGPWTINWTRMEEKKNANEGMISV